ncbi:hypothetical protein C2E21_8296 [Chlorella sorokiniana]|jgi:mannose-6-phosphate isomerase-like protein (cupin superfamily)|uniref:Cupin type-1 domain-containing protein n=1 Tax=Chlorella sorokiniana TaxID=3076 RepID=A0A2P6TEV5_CHLSO|nr:hypothetical protein C2E21_8296 [Chlorella sorokiniana]|eukprot:PRW32499.1 hypothetical protein C2E21_8296 [Chlorella sorokiniana]
MAPSRPAAATALALCLAAACLSAASASPIYTGPSSFIGDLGNTTAFPPIELDGATLRLATANEVYGLGLAGMSALHITLAPCTILQPHTHPHSEFIFTIKGSVTHSIPYYNMTLTEVKENTEKDVGNPGFAVFPPSHLHVTQNEGCTPAELIAVFNVPAVGLQFFPYTEAYLPANTVESYFGGKLDNNALWKPVGTAKLAGCKCNRRMAA